MSFPVKNVPLKVSLIGLFSYFMQRAHCCSLFSQKPPVKINTALLAKKKFSNAYYFRFSWPTDPLRTQAQNCQLMKCFWRCCRWLKILKGFFGGLCDTQTNMMQQWPPRGLGLAFVVVVVEVYCLKCNRMATVFIRRVVSRV